jgi:protein involved in polysaccharide export with SLBB domain
MSHRMRRHAAAAAFALLALLGAGFVARPASAAPADEGTAASGAAKDAATTAGERAIAAAGPLAGAVDASRYPLGPGDILSLELSGRASRQTTLVVDAEGRLNLPEMGVVDVSGVTLEAARNRILARLRGVYPGARVDLRLIALRQFKVYVAGQVKTPGVTGATAATRASELFRGPLELREDASRRNIELRRRDGRTVRVDLDAFAYLGSAADDPYVEDGDVLLVPPRRERIYALGAFARPGEYEYAPGDSLSDLIALAGGLQPGAEFHPGMLVRFQGDRLLDSTAIDLPAVIAGRGDRALAPRDRIFARTAPDFRTVRNVTVAGEVRLPGPYALGNEEDRLADVLAHAGGPTAEAARTRIQVFRRGSGVAPRDIEFERLSRLNRAEMTDAEYTVFKTKLASQQAAFVVSYEELLADSSAFDVRLEDGDYVYLERETQSIRVSGEVLRPALVEFVPGRTGKEYIALAGGFTQRARRGDVRVTRAGSSQILLLDDVREIQAGDFIWVPEKKDVSFWGVFKDVILVAGSVATVIILVRDASR